MPKIFSPNTKFKVIVYGEHCTETSWQDMMQACFGYMRKIIKSS